MTEKTTAPTCTVNAAQFVEALRDLVLTSGADPVLPMIHGVLLHTDTYDGRTVLVGTSTDRFRLGQAHMECTGSIPQTFVSLGDCKRLLATLKLYTKGNTEARLDIYGDLGGLMAQLDTLTVPVTTETPLDDVPGQQFPKMARIFSDWNTTPEQRDTFFPKYLGVFASIAATRNEHLHVQLQGKGKPALFVIGERYRGLLMPVRNEGTPALPWFVPAKEQEQIAAVAQRKADAEAVIAKAKAREDRNAKRRADRAAAKTEQPAKKTAAKKPAAKRATRTKAAA